MGLIVLVIIVSIAFGVTLHEAFWGIIGTFAALCGIGWLFFSDSGKKVALVGAMIVGVTLGVFMCYDGISKKASNEKVYNDDIHSCKYDQWRYEGAKVYNNGGYYYDQNKVNAIGNKCVQEANKNRQSREDWWLLETFGGAMIVFCSIGVFNETRKDKKNKQ